MWLTCLHAQMIAKVTTPVEYEEALDNRKYDEYTQEAGGYGQNRAKVEIVQRINHDGEVNRARYLPQNPTVIATKGPSKDVLVFDYTKHPSLPAADGVCKPDLRLCGHSEEGFGLCWNPLREGFLVSASNDGGICMWDVEAKAENKCISVPLASFSAHTAAVQDVSCNNFSPHIFASCGDDKALMIWDDKVGAKPVSNVKAHSAEVNAVSFNPHKHELLLTASADKTVAMWDIRNLSKSLFTFQHHQDSVMQVQWSPERAGDGRRVGERWSGGGGGLESGGCTLLLASNARNDLIACGSVAMPATVSTLRTLFSLLSLFLLLALICLPARACLRTRNLRVRRPRSPHLRVEYWPHHRASDQRGIIGRPS